MNFVYWRLRGQVEQTDDMLTARKLIHQGDRAYAEGDLDRRPQRLPTGPRTAGAKCSTSTPSLVPDQTTGDDLMDVIKRYRRILSQLDEPFPRAVHPSGRHRRPRKNAGSGAQRGAERLGREKALTWSPLPPGEG